MMLNLFIELQTESISLPTKNGFTVVYRPYGQKERLTLGPKFGTTITLLSTVGES